MIILGIDTSGRNASITIYDSESEVICATSSFFTKLTHSQIIMPMCKDVLQKANLTLNDVDRIAVANGPGSYTGLRIGVSAVKALSFALNCECVGVSTLKALAFNNVGYNGIICSVIKARGDLVYTAIYRSDGLNITALSDETIMTFDDLKNLLLEYSSNALICGDATLEFCELYNTFTPAPPHLRHQSANGICLLASSETSVLPENLNVSYLQKVKAEKDLEKKELYK